MAGPCDRRYVEAEIRFGPVLQQVVQYRMCEYVYMYECGPCRGLGGEEEAEYLGDVMCLMGQISTINPINNNNNNNRRGR